MTFPIGTNHSIKFRGSKGLSPAVEMNLRLLTEPKSQPWWVIRVGVALSGHGDGRDCFYVTCVLGEALSMESSLTPIPDIISNLSLYLNYANWPACIQKNNFIRIDCWHCKICIFLSNLRELFHFSGFGHKNTIHILHKNITHADVGYQNTNQLNHATRPHSETVKTSLG